MTGLIKLDAIQKNIKKFYEVCSDIGILQRELEEMLVAIERNSKDFEKGKISKDIFKYNDNRLKKESAKIIKSINSSVEQGKTIIKSIDKEVESQKVKKKAKDVKKVVKIKEVNTKDSSSKKEAAKK